MMAGRARIRISRKTHRRIIFLLLAMVIGLSIFPRCSVSHRSVHSSHKQGSTVPSIASIPSQDLALPYCPNETFLIRNEIGRYTLLYDTLYRQANWVAYLLTRQDVNTKNATRKNPFKKDPEVVRRGWPTAALGDYKDTDFDRGHLLPAADRTTSQAENNATFHLSNISPQYPALNQKIWRLLEEQVRRWADRYDSIYIITGGELKSGLSRMSGGVGVPEYFYKALLVQSGEEYYSIAFLIPNLKTVPGRFTDYIITVDSLERRTGHDFFHQLPQPIQQKTESRTDTAFWN